MENDIEIERILNELSEIETQMARGPGDKRMVRLARSIENLKQEIERFARERRSTLANIHNRDEKMKTKFGCMRGIGSSVEMQRSWKQFAEVFVEYIKPVRGHKQHVFLQERQEAFARVFLQVLSKEWFVNETYAVLCYALHYLLLSWSSSTQSLRGCQAVSLWLKIADSLVLKQPRDRANVLLALGTLISKIGTEISDEEMCRIARSLVALICKSRELRAINKEEEVVLASLTRALHLLLSEARPFVHTSVCSEVVDIAQALFTYERYDGVASNSAVALYGNTNNGKYIPPNQRQQARSHASSESDISDNESTCDNNSPSARVRANVLMCLQAICRKDGRLLHAYWPRVLPTYGVSQQKPYQPTIFTCLLYDTSRRVRKAAGLLIADIMGDSSKTYFSAAEYRSANQRGPFTTLSDTLGLIAVEANKGFLIALRDETALEVLSSTLTALEAFIRIVPFQRLPSGLKPSILNCLCHILFQKVNWHTYPGDLNLVCTPIILSIGSLIEALEPDNDKSAVFEILFGHVSCPGKGLLPQLIELSRSNIQANATVEIFKAVSKGAKTFPREFLNSLMDEWELALLKYCALKTGLDDKIASAMIQILLDVTRSTAKIGDKRDADFSHTILRLNNLWRLYWEKVFQDLHRKSNSVRVCILNAMSQMFSALYNVLDDGFREVIIRYSLSSCEENAVGIRVAACRSLGNLCMILGPDTKCRGAALIEPAIIRGCEDQSPTVQVVASWAFANLSDAVRSANICGPNSCLYSNSEVFKLARTGLDIYIKKGVSDKVRANAVRGLGNLSRVVDFDIGTIPELNQLELPDCILCALQSTNDKVVWNACYAASQLFANPQLLEFSHHSIGSILTQLKTLIESGRTFKVRGHACVALACLQEQKPFMEYLKPCIYALERFVTELERFKLYSSRQHQPHNAKGDFFLDPKLLEEISLALVKIRLGCESS